MGEGSGGGAAAEQSPGIESRERPVAAERPEIKTSHGGGGRLRAAEIRLGRQVGKY